MGVRTISMLVIAALVLVTAPPVLLAADCGPRPCLQDIPIPPGSIGPVSVPFDVPIWPTLLKTEFHILPWVSFGRASICIPGTACALEIPAPCLSLKPIPIWIPWLRPLDAECKDPAICGRP